MTAKSIERNTDKFKGLPQDFQEAIQTSEYDLSLETITKKHRLHIDQSATLEDLLSKFIFGEIESSNLISEMEVKINISKDAAAEIVKDIDQLIIVPIRENLQKIQSSTEIK